MTWTGTKSMNDIRVAAEALLASRYSHREHDGGVLFTNKDSVDFHVCIMGDSEPWNALVIEYMDTMEDGDLFYPEDYRSINELVTKMEEEIDLPPVRSE